MTLPNGAQPRYLRENLNIQSTEVSPPSEASRSGGLDAGKCVERLKGHMPEAAQASALVEQLTPCTGQHVQSNTSEPGYQSMLHLQHCITPGQMLGAGQNMCSPPCNTNRITRGERHHGVACQAANVSQQVKQVMPSGAQDWETLLHNVVPACPSGHAKALSHWLKLTHLRSCSWPAHNTAEQGSSIDDDLQT
jgi:hypothetical protein